MKIYLVTVNYYSRDCLKTLLESVEELKFNQESLKIFIVDSSNDLDEDIFKNFTRSAELIKPPENRGFAYSANIGMHSASLEGQLTGSPYAVWLINPDLILHPESLNELLKAHSPDAILGSAVTQAGFNPNSDLWGVGGYLDQELNPSMGYIDKKVKDLPSTLLHCDYVPGCSMLIPSQVLLNKNCLLPEAYFLYFEETDWCLKLKEQGYKLQIAPKSLVHHVCEPEKMAEPLRVYFYNRNSSLFKLRNLNSSAEKRKLIFKLLFSIPRLLRMSVYETDEKLKTTFKAHLFASYDAIRIWILSFLKVDSALATSKKRLKELK